MKEILDKLSSYNIFNYLLPGILYATFGSRLTSFPLLLDDLIIGVFVYYFYGLVVSRFGSLIIGPLMKRFGSSLHEPYEKYVSAAREDSKLETLLEVGNMYRTLAALFICLMITMLCESLSQLIGLSDIISSIFCLAFFAVLFAVSYKKQYAYISLRVGAASKSK